MDDATRMNGDLLRLIGFMGVCVGAAWALQVLGFDGEGPGGRLLWTLASASVAGAGTGMILAARALRPSSVRA